MRHFWTGLLITLVLVLMGSNLLLLDIAYFKDKQDFERKVVQIVASHQSDQSAPTPQATQAGTLSPTPSATPTPTAVQTATVTKSQSSVAEYYIPLGGNATTTNDQWEDMPGVETIIDTAAYPSIKTVYFEASVRIPTKNGRVYARLYNVTDKHPVWFSDVSTESDISNLVISSPITLDSGNKLYRVQMKTTLRYASILDFARIRIISR